MGCSVGVRKHGCRIGDGLSLGFRVGKEVGIYSGLLWTWG